jgi:hypothetical protein
MILYIGPLPTDLATGGFSYGLPAKAKIILHSDFVSIGEEKWEGLHFVPIFKKLIAQLSQNCSGLTKAKPKAIVNAIVAFNALFGETNISIGCKKQHFESTDHPSLSQVPSSNIISGSVSNPTFNQVTASSPKSELHSLLRLIYLCRRRASISRRSFTAALDSPWELFLVPWSHAESRSIMGAWSCLWVMEVCR